MGPWLVEASLGRLKFLDSLIDNENGSGLSKGLTVHDFSIATLSTNCQKQVRVLALSSLLEIKCLLSFCCTLIEVILTIKSFLQKNVMIFSSASKLLKQ